MVTTIVEENDVLAPFNVGRNEILAARTSLVGDLYIGSLIPVVVTQLSIAGAMIRWVPKGKSLI